MRGPFALMIALAGVLAAGPAAAERLIASLTNHRVMITSSYAGVELVLFGSVERDAASVDWRAAARASRARARARWN